MDEAPMAFGCIGCARTNELIKYLVRKRKIPRLDLVYPKNEEEAKVVVQKIAKFLKELE